MRLRAQGGAARSLLGEVDGMPYWKLLMVAGLALSFVGSLVLALMAGVPWVMPRHFQTKRGARLWYGAVALIPLGFLLQLLGTILSP